MPVTKLAYQKLLVANYSMQGGKIGAVVLAEIDDVLKDSKPYDEK